MRRAHYYLLEQELLTKLKDSKKKPTLLLHACCAPCASYPLELLADYFDITIFFNNSNIYPQKEYEKRLHELENYLTNFQIKLVVTKYDNVAYNQKIAYGAKEPERGRRCFYCYAIRMDEAYHYAETNHYDYFTTVMTISRQKDSQKINEIGQALAKKYHYTKYFYSDFKKNNGLLRRNELVKKYQLYNQTYCGCIYSYQQSLEKKAFFK